MADLDFEQTHYIPPGDLLALASIFANRGLIYYSMAQLNQAEISMQQAISISEAANARWIMMRQVGNMGMIAFARGDLRKAILYIDHQISLAQQFGDQHELLLAKGNHGAALLYLGQYQAAMKEIKECQEAFKAAGLTELLIGATLDLAMCLLNLGDKERSYALTEEAFELAQNTDFQGLQIIAMRHLALHKPPDEAREILAKALDLAKKIDREMDIAGCMMSMIPTTSLWQEKAVLWKEAANIIESMGASAWLDGHSITNPPWILATT